MMKIMMKISVLFLVCIIGDSIIFAGLEENKRKRFGMNGAMGDLMILGGIAFLVFGGFCFCLL